MARFNQKKYDPRRDSSPGHKRTKDKLILEVQEGQCACGCTDKPAGAKSKFKMGHDARLRGKLIRAHLTGTPVVMIESEARPSPVFTALEVAQRHGWQQYLKDADTRRDGKNRQVLNKAMGSKRLVKVGRWEYTGQVVAIYEIPGNGEEYDVEYVTKMGDVKKTRVKASEAKRVGGKR